MTAVPTALEARERDGGHAAARQSVLARSAIAPFTRPTPIEIRILPWWTVEADDKRRARLNCIAHVLKSVPYHDVAPPPLDLPRRRAVKDGYVRSTKIGAALRCRGDRLTGAMRGATPQAA